MTHDCINKQAINSIQNWVYNHIDILIINGHLKQLELDFDINQYRIEDVYKDSDKTSKLRFSTFDLENEEFSFTNGFSLIKFTLSN